MKQIPTITSYIKDSPEGAQKALKRIYKEIKAIMPNADQSISYGIPTFKINGKPVIYFAGFKKHISLYPMTGNIKEKFKKEFTGLKTSAGTVQFPLSEPIPFELIKKVAKYRLKEATTRK